MFYNIKKWEILRFPLFYLQMSKICCIFASDLEKDILHRPKRNGQRWGATREE